MHRSRLRAIMIDCLASPLRTAVVYRSGWGHMTTGPALFAAARPSHQVICRVPSRVASGLSYRSTHTRDQCEYSDPAKLGWKLRTLGHQVQIEMRVAGMKR